MSGPLKKLTVSYLRGATNPFVLEFDAHKPLTLIYGENGTGKSTICDALEILGGSYTSLDDRGLGKTARYWPSIGKHADDLSVCLEMQHGGVTATLKKGEILLNPAGAGFRVEILRGRQLSRLIQAPAANRYDAIRKFVDVTGIESCEDRLRDLISALKAERNTSIVQISENDAFIRDVWTKNGSLSGDPIVWARNVSGTNVSEEFDDGTPLARLSALYVSLESYPHRHETLRAEYIAASDSAEAAAAHSREVASSGTVDTTATLAVLKAVSAYLGARPTPSACPACESTEKVARLHERVVERLAELATVDSAVQAASSAAEVARRASTALEDLSKQLVTAVERFTSFRDSRRWSSEVVLPERAAPTEIVSLAAWLSDTAQIASTWNGVAANHTDRRRFVEALRLALEILEENTKRANDLDLLIPRVERAHELVKEERREFIDDVLRNIATDVSRLYELVHPGEDLNKIGLALNPNRRASLDIDTVFLGTDCPPQAYFSDSHLDTLGLCLFLAIAARETPTDVLLVLDDVLASVDEPHVERLIQTIYIEAQKFRHCLLTTHYRPWKEKMRWGWLRHGSCQLVELGTWSGPNGISTIKMLPEVEKLRLLLEQSPPDVQAICAKAGVILEAALDFLTQLYECAVPRKAGGRYTLGELLPAIDKKLRRSLMVEILVTSGTAASAAIYNMVQLGPILDELARIAQVRNVSGCHFNELTFDLLDTDGILFGATVLLLLDALADQEAGWPRNDKSGSYWATSGETRRLHPLRQPK